MSIPHTGAEISGQVHSESQMARIAAFVLGKVLRGESKASVLG